MKPFHGSFAGTLPQGNRCCARGCERHCSRRSGMSRGGQRKLFARQVRVKVLLEVSDEECEILFANCISHRTCNPTAQQHRQNSTFNARPARFVRRFLLSAAHQRSKAQLSELHLARSGACILMIDIEWHVLSCSSKLRGSTWVGACR